MAYKSMLAGHSVGAWWRQQEPFISRDNPRSLDERMVIAMEPHVEALAHPGYVRDPYAGPELILAKLAYR